MNGATAEFQFGAGVADCSQNQFNNPGFITFDPATDSFLSFYIYKINIKINIKIKYI